MKQINHIRSIFSWVTALYILTSDNNCAKAEAGNPLAYTCCNQRNAFRDKGACSCLQHSSEFEASSAFHQAQWAVPKEFRQNQSEFTLTLDKRNEGNLSCTVRYWINGKYGTSTTAINNVPLQVGDSETVDKESSPLLPIFFNNGSMLYKNVVYAPSEYCFDRISNAGKDVELDIAVLECGCANHVAKNSYSSRPPYNEDWINQLFAAVSGLSGLFSVLNVIIYLSLRHYLNVSGWVEFVYFLSLGVFSVFSIPAFLYHHSTSQDDYFCIAISGILHFSEIMTYSAYFMIAFDVFWMLRKSDTFASYGEELEESKMRLAIYYLILFAVPIGLITYGILLNQESIISTECGTITVPKFGKKSCFAPTWLPSEYIAFGTESATLVMILLSVNHVFGRLSASADVDDAPRVSLLSNMFFFTLSYWIIGLLKFARPLLRGLASENDDVSSEEPFWIALDGFTYAQGILSFVVFIFNRKTLKALRRKAGTDGTLKALFRHACGGTCSRVNENPDDDAGTPLSPLMKTTSLRRSTIRQNHLY